MLPGKNQATAIGNMHKKFGELGLAVSEQTDRHTVQRAYMQRSLTASTSTHNVSGLCSAGKQHFFKVH